jgi:predicted nucleic acid-binding protein
VIPGNAVVYVDTNALIYAVERVQPYATLLRPVWEAAVSKMVRLIGSELLILETLAGPLRTGDQALIAAYEQALRANDLQLLPITPAILRQGAAIRANYRLNAPDAIHAASALSAGCSMYLTNDEAFRRVPQLAPTILNDLLVT